MNQWVRGLSPLSLSLLFLSFCLSINKYKKGPKKPHPFKGTATKKEKCDTAMLKRSPLTIFLERFAVGEKQSEKAVAWAGCHPFGMGGAQRVGPEHLWSPQPRLQPPAAGILRKYVSSEHTSVVSLCHQLIAVTTLHSPDTLSEGDKSSRGGDLHQGCPVSDLRLEWPFLMAMGWLWLDSWNAQLGTDGHTRVEGQERLCTRRRVIGNGSRRLNFKT